MFDRFRQRFFEKNVMYINKKEIFMYESRKQGLSENKITTFVTFIIKNCEKGQVIKYEKEYQTHQSCCLRMVHRDLQQNLTNRKKRFL